jgi:predicted PurR-regulated permease PerM
MTARTTFDAPRTIFATLVVAATSAGFLLLYEYGQVLFGLLLGVVVATALRPSIDYLSTRGVARWVATLALFGLALVVLVGFMLLVAPMVAEQLSALAVKLPPAWRRLHDMLAGSSSTLLRRLAASVPNGLPAHPIAPDAALGQAWGTLSQLGHALVTTVAILLFGYYWALDGEVAVRTLLYVVPLERQVALREFIDEAQLKVGAFVRGQSLVCLVMSALAYLAYAAIGLPYALVLALSAGLLEALPVVGPLAAGALSILVGLGVSPWTALEAALVTLVLHVVEGYLLVPRVMTKSVGVSAYVTLLSIGALGSLLGVTGAVLAIPVAAVAQLLARRMLARATAAAMTPDEQRDHASVLRYEARALALDARKLTARATGDTSGRIDRVEDSIEAIATDLAHVLGEAEAR